MDTGPGYILLNWFTKSKQYKRLVNFYNNEKIKV